MDLTKFYARLREDVVPVAAGCIAFSATLGLSTCAQKAAGITTGTQWLAQLVGVPTVCFASLASHRSVLLAQEWIQNPQSLRDVKSSLDIVTSEFSSEHYEIGRYVRIPKQDVHMYVYLEL